MKTSSTLNRIEGRQVDTRGTRFPPSVDQEQAMQPDEEQATGYSMTTPATRTMNAFHGRVQEQRQTQQEQHQCQQLEVHDSQGEEFNRSQEWIETQIIRELQRRSQLLAQLEQQVRSAVAAAEQQQQQQQQQQLQTPQIRSSQQVLPPLLGLASTATATTRNLLARAFPTLYGTNNSTAALSTAATRAAAFLPMPNISSTTTGSATRGPNNAIGDSTNSFASTRMPGEQPTTTTTKLSTMRDLSTNNTTNASLSLSLSSLEPSSLSRNEHSITMPSLPQSLSSSAASPGQCRRRRWTNSDLEFDQPPRKKPRDKAINLKDPPPAHKDHNPGASLQKDTSTDKSGTNGSDSQHDNDDYNVRFVPMSLDSDRTMLTPYQCFVREQVGFLEVTVDERNRSAQGRNKPLQLGQVGVVCRHCASLPPRKRARGAVYFPARLHGVYQSVQNLVWNHLLDTCVRIPPQTRDKLRQLRATKDVVWGGGRRYWIQGVLSKGVVECDGHLVFDRSKQQQQKQQHEDGEQQLQQQQGERVHNEQELGTSSMDTSTRCNKTNKSS